MISNEGIVDNLYSLYGLLADRGLVVAGKVGAFEWVQHKGFAWPNMAYRRGRGEGVAGRGGEVAGAIALVPGREEIHELKESMAAGDCPRLVILEGAAVTEAVQGIMAAERLIAATEWVNMAMPVGETGDVGGTGSANGLEVREIDADDPKGWGEWASVAAGVLFRNVPLDPVLFRKAGAPVGMPDATPLILMAGYVRGEAVASCLLYLGEHAGLYMVATVPACQGKGFGRVMIMRARALAAARGYAQIVLHSTKAGLNFYNRLGFKTYGKLCLYYGMP